MAKSFNNVFIVSLFPICREKYDPQSPDMSNGIAKQEAIRLMEEENAVVRGLDVSSDAERAKQFEEGLTQAKEAEKQEN